MTGGRYRVIGQRAYRGHQPGSVFDAVLDPAAEARAIARGTIDLVTRKNITIPPRSYRLPVGWTTQKED